MTNFFDAEGMYDSRPPMEFLPPNELRPPVLELCGRLIPDIEVARVGRLEVDDPSFSCPAKDLP